jgi:hypothetical protein
MYTMQRVRLDIFYQYKSRVGHVVVQLDQALRYRPEGRRSLEFFHWHNPSGHTMGLGSTQPPTEMSSMNIYWGKGGQCVGLIILHLMCQLSWNLGASASRNPLGLFWPVQGLLYFCVKTISGWRICKVCIADKHVCRSLLPSGSVSSYC